MKKLLTIAMMTAAVSALAVESSNTFGILRVTIPAGQKTSIIAAPWIDAGSTGESIKVKDLIKTANLTPASSESATDGDKIYVYHEGAYTAAFQLTTTGWSGISMVITGSGTTSGGDENTAITRGDAVILDLNEAPAGATDIYLYGQYKVPPVSMSVTAGTTLIAAPMTDDLYLNNATWTGLTGSDRIYIGATMLYWRANVDDGSWCTVSVVNGKNTFTKYDSPVPAGTGVWLKASGAVTINWASVQQ